MTKDDLRNMPYINDLINSKIRQQENIRNYREAIPTPQTGDKVQNSNKSDITADTAIKIVVLEDAINKEIDRLVSLRLEAEKLIKTLQDAKLRTIMELRYMECKKWDDIMDITHYSWGHMHRLHGQALEILFPTKHETQ